MNSSIEMNYPDRLRAQMRTDGIVPLIGIYDVFSASIAARHFNGLFLSGFSFAASFYGLPDVGFISWSDITSLAQRIRLLLPNHHIVVDIDDGYCDADVACPVRCAHQERNRAHGARRQAVGRASRVGPAGAGT